MYRARKLQIRHSDVDNDVELMLALEAPEELEAPDAGEEGSPAKWASEAAAWAAREAGVEAPPPADDGEDWAPRSSPLGKSLSKAAREAAMEIG